MEAANGDIRFSVEDHLGIVTLARPQALNALTHAMLLDLESQLRAWEGDDSVRHVLIRGEGRAFCAGGDLLALYEARGNGLSQLPFFADEYRINAFIRHYPKPYIALFNGIAMGGGVGISVHGRFRIATENAVFAMPEVGIGFFPDVGGSYFLSRLPGHFGMYMGLTGARIRRGDMLRSGIATHAVDSARTDDLIAALASNADAETTISAFEDAAEAETSAQDRHTISEVFSASSLPEVMLRLEMLSPNDGFSAKTLAAILQKSPTSLAVAFRQLRDGAHLSMNECMAMEYRIVSRMLAGHDFFEGIRTVLVDKGDKPLWQPHTIAALDSAAIDRYFDPVVSGELLL